MEVERLDNLPTFDESSIAAVHLLQGVVYRDEERVWTLATEHQTRLNGYFNRIGLRLVIDEAEGFAYLRQLGDEELESVPGYGELPKLFRRKRLNFDATLASVLLREELRRFDEEELDHSRCVVTTDSLFDQWKSFFPASQDEVRLKKALLAALGTLEELKFIREFTKDPQEWEVRRILKARLSVKELERLLLDLKTESESRASQTSEGDAHE